MKVDYQQLYTQINQSIRNARITETQTLLLALRLGKIPRDLRMDFARAARRANLPDLTVRILNPLVRPSRQSTPNCTPEEAAEYASGLIKLGAIPEARGILLSASASAAPMARLYLAFADIAEWEYKNSLVHLEAVLQSPETDAYTKVVAKANFAAGLIHEKRLSEGRAALAELDLETRNSAFHFIRGHLLQQFAQAAYCDGDWSEALRQLNLAEKLHRVAGGAVNIFIEKWRAFIALRSRGIDDKSLAGLAEVRTHAQLLSHWETVRDCDRELALLTHNHELALRVYFGTRYGSYRKRLIEEFAGALHIPDEYPLSVGKETLSQNSLHLSDIRDSESPLHLKEGQLLDRTIRVLCTDFYRPFSFGALFASVYRGEFFNPDTSPHRIHQAVLRLRQWMQIHRLPIDVEESHSLYQLSSRVGCNLMIPHRLTVRRDHEIFLDNLSSVLGNNMFSANQAAIATGVSRWIILRHLQRCCDDQILTRIGKGKATKYQLRKLHNQAA